MSFSNCVKHFMVGAAFVLSALSFGTSKAAAAPRVQVVVDPPLEAPEPPATVEARHNN